MMIPGKIENWFLVIDMKDIGFLDMVVGEVKGVADICDLVFKNRMHMILIINTPWILMFFYELF